MARPRINEWDGWQSTAEREATPRLEPVFGCKPYTPQTTCADIHPGGKIPRGSNCCCMAVDCHKSGQDHRQLAGEPIGSRIDPDYPVDAVTTVYAPEAEKPETETRKQKRAKKSAGEAK